MIIIIHKIQIIIKRKSELPLTVPSALVPGCVCQEDGGFKPFLVTTASSLVQGKEPIGKYVPMRLLSFSFSNFTFTWV